MILHCAIRASLQKVTQRHHSVMNNHLLLLRHLGTPCHRVTIADIRRIKVVGRYVYNGTSPVLKRARPTLPRHFCEVFVYIPDVE